MTEDASHAHELIRALGSLPSAAFVARLDDDTAQIEAANAELEALVGRPVPARCALSDLFGAASGRDLHADMQRCLTLGARLTLELSVDRTDQPLHLRAEIAAVGPASDRRVVAVLVDLTRVKESERAARRDRARLQQSVRRDTLTGALNRRHFFLEAERRLGEAHEAGLASSIVMLDLDHFKKLNDTFGHEVGDRALVETSSACLTVVRDADLFGRLGGEEFALLLVGTDIDDGRRVAERLRRTIEAIRVPTRQGVTTITASLGLARLAPWQDLTDALRRADKALYEAKRRARNVLAVYEELTWTEDDA